MSEQVKLSAITGVGALGSRMRENALSFDFDVDPVKRRNDPKSSEERIERAHTY